MAAPRVEIPEVVLSGGLPVSGASVQVNLRGAGAATVYAAETGGTTASNPIVTDANGRIEGWLEEGSYDLVVSGTGFTTYTQYFEAVRGNNSPGKLLAATGDLLYAASANNLARLGIGSTGQALVVVSGLPAWGNVGAGTPATSLPGSPTDGQQAILVDSTSAPTYAWLFQYSSTASEWIFLGGSAAMISVATFTTTTTATYQDITGLTFTLPRAGAYEIQMDIASGTSSGGGVIGYGLVVSGANVNQVATGANNWYGYTTSYKKTGAAASDIVKGQGHGGAANAGTYADCVLRVRPIAVT